MLSSSIITILSLLALSTLSFTVVFGSHNFLDTPTRDTLAHDSQFSLPKSNVVQKRRALNHARATTPVPASGSNSPQSNPTPSQSAPFTPDANTQASSAAPFSSPAPSSSAQPSPTQDNPSSAPSPSRAASTSPGTSAASAAASASALSSSTPALSSSSFSNVQASSSSGLIRSTVGATSNIGNTPITTFGNNPISTSGSRPTEAGSTISSGATASAHAASAFFNNKAAVGATFSIVGIVGGLAVIMAVLTLMKRRRRARFLIEDEEFFEKHYPSAEPHLPPGFGSGSAEPSVTDFNMSAAPADAYPDRAVHYGQSNAGAVLNPVDYGIAYPPGAANNNNSTPADTDGNMDEDSESEYSSGSHPFADPPNTSDPSSASPVTYSRPIPGRVQEMVTTDSYYGPNSAGLGAGAVGYAQ